MTNIKTVQGDGEDHTLIPDEEEWREVSTTTMTAPVTTITKTTEADRTVEVIVEEDRAREFVKIEGIITRDLRRFRLPPHKTTRTTTVLEDQEREEDLEGAEAIVWNSKTIVTGITIQGITSTIHDQRIIKIIITTTIEIR